MLSPDDAGAFRNITLICISIGFIACMGYHILLDMPNVENKDLSEITTSVSQTCNISLY